LIDGKQFIVTNRKFGYCDFLEISCKSTFIYYEKSLRISFATDVDGCDWYLFGQAYCVNEYGKTPMDDIKECHTDEIAKKYFFWTGRWCLFGNNQFHSDCVGLMSLYYFNDNGQWYVTPSLHLIYDFNFTTFQNHKKNLFRNGCLDWFPAPLCRLNGVKRTVATQYLLLKGGEITPEFRENLNFKKNKYEIDRDKKVDLLCQYLKTGLKNIQKFSGKEIWLALTGGGDSRTVLSALINQKIPFKTYLFDHPLITRGDKEIPFKIAEKNGFSHLYIKPKCKKSPKLLNEFDTHTFFSLNDANRIFYARKQFEQIPSNVICIKSAVFEVGRGYYRNRIPNPNPSRQDFFRIIPDIGKFENYLKSLNLYFDWCEEHPIDMSLPDRYYMEERNGGWLANLEQAFEICPWDSIHIANSAAFVSEMVSLGVQKNNSKEINIACIQKMDAKLLEFPINPPDIFSKLKYYFSRLIKNPFSVVKLQINKINNRRFRKKL